MQTLQGCTVRNVPLKVIELDSLKLKIKHENEKKKEEKNSLWAWSVFLL